MMAWIPKQMRLGKSRLSCRLQFQIQDDDSLEGGVFTNCSKLNMLFNPTALLVNAQAILYCHAVYAQLSPLIIAL